MKKTLYLLIVLFIFYLLIQIIFNYVGPGHNIQYKVDGFSINEILTQHKKNEIDGYHFEIKKDDLVFVYQIDNIRKGSKLIKDIAYFKNVNYECIRPILRIKGDYLNTICKKGDTYYNYSDIEGNDPEVDQFASKYDKVYKNSTKVLKDNTNLYVYDNLIENHYIALEYYKGVFVINPQNTYKRFSLFRKEKTGKKLSVLVNNYYLVADYNSDYEFHKFYLIDLEYLSKDEIISNSAISFNSYIQGVVDNSVYLFDKDNKKQYKINVKTNQVSEIGNESKGIKVYQNHEFVDSNVYEASEKELTFNKYSTSNVLNNKEYTKIDLVGGEKTGYYYLYEKNGNNYNVYQVPVSNTSIKKYLFSIDDLNGVKYANNYVYYIKEAKLYAYGSFGTRLILNYNNFIYNKDLKYDVYVG